MKLVRRTMRWNVTTILHRMQGVMRVFLRYHRYEVGRGLVARPETGWGREKRPQDFGVGGADTSGGVDGGGEHG
ncbi:MAG: hypothetical protein NZ821_09815, partial [Gloeomargarita sp. SKYB31]|nr:hypothetical protein [Gloeomargarita sp. SKYB31]